MFTQGKQQRDPTTGKRKRKSNGKIAQNGASTTKCCCTQTTTCNACSGNVATTCTVTLASTTLCTGCYEFGGVGLYTFSGSFDGTYTLTLVNGTHCGWLYQTPASVDNGGTNGVVDVYLNQNFGAGCVNPTLQNASWEFGLARLSTSANIAADFIVYNCFYVRCFLGGLPVVTGFYDRTAADFPATCADSFTINNSLSSCGTALPTITNPSTAYGIATGGTASFTFP
jgi:hypothetical protein